MQFIIIPRAVYNNDLSDHMSVKCRWIMEGLVADVLNFKNLI